LDGRVRYSAAPRRRDELLRHLAESGYVSSSAAAAALGVSEMTIRRDLRRLAEEGRLRRVVGGASVPDAGRPFELRRTEAAGEKEAVATAAVPLLAGARVVALDAGTTVAALARHLPGGLTVVTHSVPVITRCADRDDVDVIALGGAYHRATRSFAGPATRAGLADLAVDVAVLSATAAGPAGAYSADPWDADTKRAMAAIAARVVLLLDHGKLDARAPMRVLGLDAVDAVVVDDRATGDQLAMLREHCGHVVVAPTRAAGARAVPA
jgi:DeoR/GlpR family transcriptional regulator of sugar metabolism